MKKIIIGFITILFICIMSLNVYINYNLNRKQVAVLVYHNIVLSEEYKNGDVDCLTIDEFENQLKYLKDNGYKTIKPNDFYEWKENKINIPEKSVMITFDDGYYSFKYLVQPVLEKYNYNAICFLIGNYTGEVTATYEPDKYGVIGRDEIKNHNDNIEYGSHTYGLHELTENNEKYINLKTKEELMQDVVNFKDNLFEAEYLAYPFYTYTKDMIDVLKQYNYKLAFAGEEEMATSNVNNYKVPRISGVKNIEDFKKIFETNEYKNKYGNGIIRKLFVNLERLKLNS